MLNYYLGKQFFVRRAAFFVRNDTQCVEKIRYLFYSIHIYLFSCKIMSNFAPRISMHIPLRHASCQQKEWDRQPRSVPERKQEKKKNSYKE